MAKLKQMILEDGSIIYVEAPADLDASEVVLTPVVDDEEEEVTRTAKGAGQRIMQQLNAQTQSIDTLIRRYTASTLKAFEGIAFADVERVSLEFGVTVDVVTGVPYIASGTAGCNLKVKVDCTFPKRDSDPAEE